MTSILRYFNELRQYTIPSYPVITPQSFGALADGATNDASAIQAAINSLSSTGGTVYFPAGTYFVGSTLTVTVSGISLKGSGRLSTIIHSTSTTNDIISVTASYTEVDSMAIVGTQNSVMTAGIGLHALNAQGCKFTNLYIADVYNGILLDNSTNCLVQFNKIFDLYGTYGIESANGGGDYIVDNQVDPLFYGHAYNFSSGYGAWGAGIVYATGAVVSANGGWFVASSGGTSAGAGAGPVATLFNTPITDNTVTWYYLGLTTLCLIRLDTANSNYVTNNDCSGPSGTGIFVTNGDGNMLIGNTVGQIIGNGIQLGATATNTLVEGNLVSDTYTPTGAGIEDSNGSATGSRIMNNYVFGSAWYGIFIQSSHFNVAGNTVTTAGQITSVYGIEVAAGTTKFSITNNNLIPAAGMTGPIRVNVGASNFYNIIGNLVEGGVIVDGGAGVNKTISGNN